jgi:hypothetical protein
LINEPSPSLTIINNALLLAQESGGNVRWSEDIIWALSTLDGSGELVWFRLAVWVLREAPAESRLQAGLPAPRAGFVGLERK